MSWSGAVQGRKRKPVGHIPGSILDLVETLGGGLAFKLLELYGGQVFYVPVQAASDHPMRRLLGDDGFEALVKHYQGIRLELPKNDSITRQHRHRLVQDLRERGYTNNEIAKRTNYTRRQVINVLNASAVAPPQLGLFDDMDPERDAEYDQGLPSAHDPFGLRVR